MMDCYICGAKFGPDDEMINSILAGRSLQQGTLVRVFCVSCARDVERQIKLLQTFHRNEPKAEGTDE